MDSLFTRLILLYWHNLIIIGAIFGPLKIENNAGIIGKNLCTANWRVLFRIRGNFSLLQ